MQRLYENNAHQTKITIGETFAAFLQKNEPFPQMILISNQYYYDYFSEKISYLLPENIKSDWFITTNQKYCNNIEVLNELIDFSERFSGDTKYTIAALGNEGVLELSSFFAGITILPNEVWLLPTSLKSLSTGLLFSNKIVKAPQNKVLLSNSCVPSRIILDDTLSDLRTSEKMLDLLILIRCGIVCDHDFLQELFKNYLQLSELKSHSLTAFFASVIDYYQENGAIIDRFGNLFEKAFYLTENGHLLSDSMKFFLGILFELIWNVETQQLDFHLANFMRWLIRLGYPLTLPKPLMIGDYGAAVLTLATQETVVQLSAVGQVSGQAKVTEKELVEVFKRYQKTLDQIRGN